MRRETFRAQCTSSRELLQLQRANAFCPSVSIASVPSLHPAHARASSAAVAASFHVMEHQSPYCSSMASSQPSVGLPEDKENELPLLSSPQKSESTYTQRQRRPPTITPKRFSRFFTPRTSSRSKPSRQNRLNRRLRDVTFNGVNNITSPAIYDRSDSTDTDERPTKRLKRVVTPHSDAPQSSPIKWPSLYGRPGLTQVDDVADLTDAFQDADTGVNCPLKSQPLPVRRLPLRSSSHRLLLRSFGGFECDLRGQRGRDVAYEPHSNANRYVSLPKDIHDFRSTVKSLPFCTVSCNTNSLVGIGDEDGTVHMIDTAAGTDFSKAHVAIKAHQNAIMDMSFSSCDYLLATTSGDQTVRVIDVQTQRVLSVLVGHLSSIKQVQFRPDNDKLLTSSARDGFVNVWDLRCSGNAKQTLRLGYKPGKHIQPGTIYPYGIMLAGPAQRTTSARDVIDRLRWPADSVDSRSGVSITAIQHLAGSRSHLLLSASEQNSSLKLFDLRVAGRNTKNDKVGYEIPASCIPAVSSHRRPTGVSALALSSDGARAYSVCKDSTVWSYSTQHLILGSAPENVDATRQSRLTPPCKMKEGLGPLYGFRHPKFRVGTFYTKAAVRKTGVDQEELLAVGSSDACPILFPTDERYLRRDPSVKCQMVQDYTSRMLSTDQSVPTAMPPIHNVGTALLNGHRRDVTSVTFGRGGELVSLGDDFVARCWRQDRETACILRRSTENKWKHGWAEALTQGDLADDDLE